MSWQEIHIRPFFFMAVSTLDIGYSLLDIGHSSFFQRRVRSHGLQISLGTSLFLAHMGSFSAADLCRRSFLSAVFDTAITSGFEDFEDAVLYACANLANADCIITRNIKDFKKSRLPVYLPNDFIKILPQL